MTATRPRRGRPKGTGIDDRYRLLEIARLTSANPELKTTTAIKRLGINDPSVIRRLRDKFNAVRADLENEIAEARAKAAVPPERGRPNLRIVSSDMPPAPTRSELPRQHVTPAAPLPAPGQLGPMAAWFGLGIAAAASAIEQQLAVSEQLMRLPTVASLLRQQVAAAEIMMQLAARLPADSGH